MHSHQFTHNFSYIFYLITYITHVSFEALKSGFVEVVLVNDVTSHGIRKPKLVLSNSRKLSFPMMYSLPILCWPLCLVLNKVNDKLQKMRNRYVRTSSHYFIMIALSTDLEFASKFPSVKASVWFHETVIIWVFLVTSPNFPYLILWFWLSNFPNCCCRLWPCKSFKHSQFFNKWYHIYICWIVYRAAFLIMVQKMDNKVW